MLGIALALFVQAAWQDPVQARYDLQGVYDEIAQATLQFNSAADVDAFHAVFFLPDWAVVDTSGRPHSWRELREQQVASLAGPRPDSIRHMLEKVSLAPGGATVFVVVETVRTITDTAGRYGRYGATHTLTEIARFRDQWTFGEGSWRMKGREQLGPVKTIVDRPASP